MRLRRVRDGKYREQVANACDDFVSLAPVSVSSAAVTAANWSALLPGQDVPLIGEVRYGFEQEDDGCPR